MTGNYVRLASARRRTRLIISVGDAGLDERTFGGLYGIVRAIFRRGRDNVRFNLRLEFETSLAAAVVVVVAAAAHFPT